MMKAVNAYYRKHKTLEGCPELTAEQVEKVKASMSQDWRKDPVPFPSYLLTNNNANIRRVRQRIEELSNRSEFVGWIFPGGEAKINEAENWLYEEVGQLGLPGLRVAIDFYLQLNERDDAYLEAHNFTRAEIEDGLKNIAQQYGVVL